MIYPALKRRAIVIRPDGAVGRREPFDRLRAGRIKITIMIKIKRAKEKGAWQGRGAGCMVAG
jgi:hypothetical protein